MSTALVAVGVAVAGEDSGEGGVEVGLVNPWSREANAKEGEERKKGGELHTDDRVEEE